MLPGSGAEALGGEPGSCPLLEGAAGPVGTAVTRVGPVAAGRGFCRARRLRGCSAGGCPAPGSVGGRLCLRRGCPFSVPRCERAPGGTAVLRQETPLQMETKTTWRDGRCFLKEGEDVGVSSLSASSPSADLPFRFPALFSSSPLQGEFLLGKRRERGKTDPSRCRRRRHNLKSSPVLKQWAARSLVAFLGPAFAVL